MSFLAEINRFSLKFKNKNLEADFNNDYITKSKPFISIGLVIFSLILIFLYIGLFKVFNVNLTSIWELFYFLIAVLIINTIGVIILINQEISRFRFDITLFIYSLIIFIWVTFLDINIRSNLPEVSNSSNIYFGIIFLIVLLVYTISRISLILSSFFGIFSWFIVNIYLINYSDLEGNGGRYFIINAVMIVSNILGIFLCYRSEL
jgi:hypothetical protein